MASVEETIKKKAKRRTKLRVLNIILIIIVLFLVNVYIVLGIVYKGGNFTVSLDSEYGKESGLIIYEDSVKKENRKYLKAKDIDFFTDISVDWLPENIDNEAEGTHNGKNYIAHTFYAENLGQETINYWAKIEIDAVVKNVDEAIRVMVIKNGERTIYAKPNKVTGQPEKGTVPFKDDTKVMVQENTNFNVEDKDKYTVVIWVEGDDPECIDSLIGGEIKMHMTLTEEHIPNPEL